MSQDRSVGSGSKWRKSQHSAANGACVEVSVIAGRVAVRDSKKPGGSVIMYSSGAWQSFLRQYKDGSKGC